MARRTLMVFAILAATLTVQAQNTSPPPKLPEPDKAALARAEKTIKDLFKADYAKKRPADMRDLSTKLINQALETKDDPAARFVLYKEAAELAAQAGEFNGALAALDELGKEFNTDLAALKVAALKAAEQSITSPALQKNLVEAALDIFPEAIAAADPNTAGDLLTVAEAAAAKTKNTELKVRIAARRTELKDVLKEFQDFQAALLKLQTDPSDGDANLIVGKYLCFIKGDWKQGLPHLSKSSDDKLRTLALRDLGKPGDAGAQIQLADDWYDVTETLPAAAKRQGASRAVYWYNEALPKVRGLSQTKAREQTAAMYKQYPGLKEGSSASTSIYAPYAGMWIIKYTNDATRRYAIDLEGNVYFFPKEKSFQQGRLIPSGDHMFSSFGDRHYGQEHLVARRGEVFVQHFNGPGRAVATGIGQKVELPERKEAVAPGAGDFAEFEGVWLFTQSDRTYRLYIFGPKGSAVFMTELSSLEGWFTRKEDHVLLDCKDNKLERTRLVDGKTMRIDLFYPASDYPSGKPHVVSTGVRLGSCTEPSK